MQNLQFLLYEQSLAYNYPDIAAEFDEQLNGCTAADIKAKSRKLAWWRCKKCGHTYQKEVHVRTASNFNCPNCKKQKELENSLYTNFQALVNNEWDYDKNTLDPKATAQFSGKEAYWKCCNGHSYKMRIDSRTYMGIGCPECMKQQKLNKSLYALHKELVDLEWDYELNEVNPWEIGAQSAEYTWWKCSTCGISWKCVTQNRTSDRTGCPECAKRRRTSFPEQALYFYIKQYFSDAINSDKHLGVELDIYIPSIHTAIEYDGVAWHTNNSVKQTEIKKDLLCKQNNINLIRIREEGLDNSHLTSAHFTVKIHNDNSLTETITNVLIHITHNENIKINLRQDCIKIYKQYNTREIAGNLAEKYPHLVEVWDTDANDGLLPTQIEARSSKFVWWKCKFNEKHKWQASLHNMTRISTSSKTLGCPFCAGKRVLPEESFATYYPDLAAQWHPTLNNLKPTEVTRASARTVWWRCKNGHEWQERIDARVARSHTCKTCGAPD